MNRTLFQKMGIVKKGDVDGQSDFGDAEQKRKFMRYATYSLSLAWMLSRVMRWSLPKDEMKLAQLHENSYIKKLHCKNSATG